MDNFEIAHKNANFKLGILYPWYFVSLYIRGSVKLDPILCIEIYILKARSTARQSGLLRDRSQTLLRRGLMQKGGSLKIFDPCKGGPKKITTDFPLKIELTCFSMGLTRNFHGKKGFPEIFFAVWRGGQKNFRDKYILHQVPPYKCLWTVCNVP